MFYMFYETWNIGRLLKLLAFTTVSRVQISGNLFVSALIPQVTKMFYCLLFYLILKSWDAKKHSWEVTEALRPGVVSLDWQRGGKTIFRSVNFAGYIGILTGVKPVSITLLFLKVMLLLLSNVR